MYPNGPYSEIESKFLIEGTITYKTYKTNANKHTKKQNPTPTEQKLKSEGHHYPIISNPPKIFCFDQRKMSFL